MRRLYLAGPITGLTYDGADDWRKTVEARMPTSQVKVLSPLRGKEYLRDYGVMEAKGYMDRVMSSPKGITTRDRNDVQTANLLIMNLLGADRVSIGTMVEVGWADAFRVPIILVMEEEGNIHDHSMVTECAGWIVDTIDEAMEVAAAMFGVHLNMATPPNPHLESYTFNNAFISGTKYSVGIGHGATCSCGWAGTPKHLESEAKADLVDHLQDHPIKTEKVGQ